MQAEPKYRVGDVVMFKAPSVLKGQVWEINQVQPDKHKRFIYRAYKRGGRIPKWFTEDSLLERTDITQFENDKRFEAMIRRVS
jgi:Lhr-like helicase